MIEDFNLLMKVKELIYLLNKWSNERDLSEVEKAYIKKLMKEISDEL
jgi:hypothetical protein